MLPMTHAPKTYSSNTGDFEFSNYRYDTQVFSSTQLNQQVNQLNFFNQSRNATNILITNMENANQLPEATAFVVDQIEIRCALELRDNAGIDEISGDLARQFRDWTSRCVAQFGYDQIDNYGMFPLAKHFPVDGVSAEVTYQSAGAVAAGAIYQGNQNTNAVIMLPIPLQISQRITFNPRLFTPVWSDIETQIRIKYMLGGTEIKSSSMR